MNCRTFLIFFGLLYVSLGSASEASGLVIIILLDSYILLAKEHYENMGFGALFFCGGVLIKYVLL